MKRTMLMTAIALLISAGLTAQNAAQNQTQTKTVKQNRSSATVQEQTRNQYQNYGQMTSEQKQLGNEERKAEKLRKKELKREQKELKKQEASVNREQHMDQNRTATMNKGARTGAPMKNAAKVSRGSGPGKK